MVIIIVIRTIRQRESKRNRYRIALLLLFKKNYFGYYHTVNIFPRVVFLVFINGTPAFAFVGLDNKLQDRVNNNISFLFRFLDCVTFNLFPRAFRTGLPCSSTTVRWLRRGYHTRLGVETTYFTDIVVLSFRPVYWCLAHASQPQYNVLAAADEKWQNNHLTRALYVPQRCTGCAAGFVPVRITVSQSPVFP